MESGKNKKEKIKIVLPKEAKKEPAKHVLASAKYLSNPHKGSQFENFVVEMLFSGEGKKLYELSKKTSDYHNRELKVSDETNTDPDLLIRFKKSQKQFAVECKYRSFLWFDDITNKPFIDWCREDQWINYLTYQQTNRTPVFIVIGVGGTPNKPNEAYCIPLKKIKSTILFDKDLKKYAKGERRYFRLYWDDNKKNLSWDRPE